MSDPRVCRGSIIAQLREKAFLQKKIEHQNQEKKCYNTKLLKNRLTCFVSKSNKDSNKILKKQIINPLCTFDKINIKNNKLARIAGPLQRRQEIQQQNEKKCIQKNLKLPLIKDIKNVINYQRNVLNDFKNVQFVPVKENQITNGSESALSMKLILTLNFKLI